MQPTMKPVLDRIFEDTMLLCQRGREAFFDLQYSLAHQEVISEDAIVPPAGARYSADSEIKVSLKKTIEASLAYKESEVAILNFANGLQPCAGKPRGNTQEEVLCRATSLYPCLCDDRVLTEFYYKHDADYISTANDDIIYTPRVRILKDDNYESLSTPFYVDVITAVAPCIGWFSEFPDELLYELHVKRARRILTVAANHKKDVLILGAFGCGAFSNDPHVVAKAYADVIPEFRKCFRTIEFANYCADEYKFNYRTFADLFHQHGLI